MEHIFISLVPVFGLILLGYLFKKISFPSHEFWPLADKLTYFVLMPTLLFYKLSTTKFDFENTQLIITPLIAICLTAITLIIFNRIFPTQNSSFTSIMQGGVRFNTYIFLALSSSIFGENGLVVGAIVMAFAIPFINIICIGVFATYSHSKGMNLIYILKLIFTNPLIIACFLGVSVNLLGLRVHVSLSNLLAIISSSALPLGLMSIGYSLVMNALLSAKKDMFVSSFAKFFILPFFVYVIGVYFELSQMMLGVLLLFALMPTAPSSFILARQLGGDIRLITTIITLQTLLSGVFVLLFLNYYM